MNDRQLLELAAKAVGISIEKWNLKQDPLIGPIGKRVIWNPLADDGDALRLAVKLRLGCIYSEGEQLSNVFKCSRHDSIIDLCERFSEHNNDPYSATRRAIVRAAAEIGKEMA